MLNQVTKAAQFQIEVHDTLPADSDRTPDGVKGVNCDFGTLADDAEEDEKFNLLPKLSERRGYFDSNATLPNFASNNLPAESITDWDMKNAYKSSSRINKFIVCNR